MKFEPIALLAALFLVLFLCSCKSSPSIPSDQVLIENFHATETSFASLVSNLSDRELLSQLGIVAVHISSEKPPEYFFTLWEKDLVGPGGYTKGYYYSATPPATLVESTDEIYSNRPADQVKAFRHIQGPWYIYYTSSN